MKFENFLLCLTNDADIAKLRKLIATDSAFSEIIEVSETEAHELHTHTHKPMAVKGAITAATSNPLVQAVLTGNAAQFRIVEAAARAEAEAEKAAKAQPVATDPGIKAATVVHKAPPPPSMEDMEKAAAALGAQNALANGIAMPNFAEVPVIAQTAPIPFGFVPPDV